MLLENKRLFLYCLLMVNSSSSAALTSTLIFARACVRDLNCESLTDDQIALLHEIASFACANAQEARWAHDDRSRIAAESDALDHQIAHF